MNKIRKTAIVLVILFIVLAVVVSILVSGIEREWALESQAIMNAGHLGKHADNMVLIGRKSAQPVT